MKKHIIAIILAALMMFNGSNFVYASDVKNDRVQNMNAVGLLTDSYELLEGEFILSAESRFYIVSDNEPSGEVLQTIQLVQQQFAADSLPSEDTLDIVWGLEEWAKPGDILLKLEDVGLGEEGYQLQAEDKVSVIAGSVDGLLYGANMLHKYFRAVEGNVINAFRASNAPDTKERTVMLDCGRKYFTAEWICNFIRQMSWMGYNAIELHFSEDGGFRADFWDPSYYTETYHPENDFSWLCGSHVQSWVKDPYREDSDAGKYLTTGELIRVLETAKKYHIDVIPSFDSPFHMDYITWKFEQNYNLNPGYSFIYDGKTYTADSVKGSVNYTGKTGAKSPTWPYYSAVDISDSSVARAFVFALYEDIADFFKEYGNSVEFSIGADEVNLSGNYSFKWEYTEFVEYINELNGMLNDKGYTCRMFNDFIGSKTYNIDSNGNALYEFDDNIEIMYWNSSFNPTTGKDSQTLWPARFFWETGNEGGEDWGDGERVIYNCIQTNCYYVLRVAATNTNYPNMDARNPENYNWTFYHSNEEDIYNEWYPADISEKGRYKENVEEVPLDKLGGAYFLVWNDYASLNTEAEIWNDVKDNTGTSEYIYSLFDRMWSNIVKMDNSDINHTLDFEDFTRTCDMFGYFPGLVSCSESASFPASSMPEKEYKANIEHIDVSLDRTVEYTYTGKEIIPEVYINGLIAGVDYIVSYSENISVGTATVKVKGIGDCTGEKTITFEIVQKSLEDFSVVLTPEKFVYTGEVHEPSVLVVDTDGEELQEGIDYTVEYSNNIQVGTGKAIVRGSGNYKGTIEKVFTIEEEPFEMKRLFGTDRYETSFAIADEYKESLGREKFDTVIVANGEDFADALSGSYLASAKQAPILLTNGTEYNIENLLEYVDNNLKSNGKVYILGGTKAVTDKVERVFRKYRVERLYGSNRYGTNIEILKEAKVLDENLLVCSGTNFADSLSGSATGNPIFLVGETLTKSQKSYLSTLTGDRIILGGVKAVSSDIEKELEALERVYGKNRYETSIEVAERFFDKPKTVVVAYAWNFPDGLCGGVLAYKLQAPIILSAESDEAEANEYVNEMKIKKSIVLGGEAVLSDSAIYSIFDGVLRMKK